MSKDIRVKLSFFDHIKTKRLIAKYGESGAFSVLRLWAYAAEYCPKGELTHFDETEWKIATGRNTDCMDFVYDLYTAGMNFLEKGKNGEIFIHDWREHQAWVFFAEERSKIARKNIEKRWKSPKPKKTKENKNNTNGNTDGIPPVYDSNTNRNTPSPSPSPSPSPNDIQTVPYEEIVSYLNSKTGQKYKASSKDTREHILARWKEGATLDDFKQAIDNMTTKWMGDSKMCQFLRPATLFSKGKFDGYVNQIISKKELEGVYL